MSIAKIAIVTLGASVVALGITLCLPAETSIDVRLVGNVTEETSQMARNLESNLNAHPSVHNVNMYIDSYGGSVDEMNVVLDVMERQKAKGVVFNCTVDSKAMSAAAQILMSCNKKNVAPRATILFHVGSMGSHVLNPVDDKYLYKMVMDDFIPIFPILTQEEQIDILSGVDVFITGVEFNKRLKQPAQ